MTITADNTTRAVVLASVMVLAVVAGGVTMASGAVINDEDGDSPPEIDADQERTRVESINITGGGIHDGRTILDGVPPNGSSLNETALLNGTDPVVGAHFGRVRLPVQTDAYDESSLHFQTRNSSLTNHPSQTIAIDFTIVGKESVEAQTVVVDYSEAADIGMEINTSATTEEFGNLTQQLWGVGPDGSPTAGPTAGQNDIGVDDRGNIYLEEGNTENQVRDVVIDNEAAEIRLIFEPDVNATISDLEFEVVWEAADSVEGINIGWPSTTIDHVLRGPEGTDDARFRVMEAGATGITSADTSDGDEIVQPGLGNPDRPATDLDLRSTDPDGDDVGTAKSFRVWDNQDITFFTEGSANRVQLYEVSIYEDNGTEYYELGAQIFSQSAAPGQAITWNAIDLGLDAGEEYFVRFPDGDEVGSNAVAILTVEELALSADEPLEVATDEDIEIDVETRDGSGGEVEAWVFSEFDDSIDEVTHVEKGRLDETGAVTLRMHPEADLAGEDDYYAVVRHKESGTFTVTDTIAVRESVGEEVEIVAPTNVTRGDIVRIELAFQNTDTGTITFGDSADSGVEVNVTVRDADEDGTAVVYLNTYQVGDGYINKGSGGATLHGPDATSRNHGFFTGDNDDAVLVGQDGQEAIAHQAMPVIGGSNGGKVLPGNRTYELRSAAGEDPPSQDNVDADDTASIYVENRQPASLDLWTAPGVGDNAIDLATIDAGGDPTSDLEAGRDADLIARGVATNGSAANATVADGDYLFIDARTEGLTGIFHEAALNENNGIAVDDIVDPPDDEHVVTDILQAAEAEGLAVNFTVASVAGATGEPVELNLSAADILGRQSTDPANFDRFVLAVNLDTDDIDLQNESRDLETPHPLRASFAINASKDWGENTTGQPLDLGPGIAGAFTYRDPIVTIDTSAIGYDPEADRIEVPREANVTIVGQTNVATGTNLSVNIVTKPGQNEPFFDSLGAIVAPIPEDDFVDQEWDIVTDVFDLDGDEEIAFEINLIRDGETITEDGDAIDGIVLVAVETRTLVLENQTRQDATSILINEYAASDPTEIAIEDAAGNEVGRTGTLESREATDPHTNVSVPLEEPLSEGEHTLTAIAFNRSQELNNVTATVTIEGDISLHNLSLSDEMLTAGEDLSVDVTVETGDVPVTRALVLSVDGEVLDSTEVELGAGNDTTIQLGGSTDGLSAGTTQFEVSSEDVSVAGQVTLETDTAEEEGDDTSDGQDDDGAGSDEEDAVEDVQGEDDNQSEDEAPSNGDAEVDDPDGGENEEEMAEDQEGEDQGQDDGAVQDGEDRSANTSSEDSDGASPDPEAELDDTDDDVIGFGTLVPAFALLGAALLAARRRIA